ncbi:MAG: metallophosphoesterase [Gemmatirosa sp.]|nr:metallophosphoesterase [Gemmatirosa sp.]
MSLHDDHGHAPAKRPSRYIADDHAEDGIDRRGFLQCMAWAGTGLLWTMQSGVPKAMAMSALGGADALAAKDVFFAQISDSHIGFDKEANKDVTATLQQAVARLNALPRRPAFVLHTGDISQLSKPAEFDTADQVLKGLQTERVLYVPGGHDVLTDNGASYLARYGRAVGAKGGGWYSFDHSGVHFIGLVNVLNLKAGGLGSLGAEQLAWLAGDVRGLSASTPIVVFAHVPLWTVYPEWGWGTDDSAQALALLKRFGSVTVLNGHIHQIMQKVEGNTQFHTAMSTAFPQPAPGSAPAPGPMKVDPGLLARVLGVTSVSYVPGRHSLAVVDATISGAPAAFAEANHQEMQHQASGKSRPALGPDQVGIDNFAFAPRALTVKAGTEVTWINRDDVPHVIVNVQRKFPESPVLDTGRRYSHRFTTPGTYEYFCSIHPTMTGTIVVQ